MKKLSFVGILIVSMMSSSYANESKNDVYDLNQKNCNSSKENCEKNIPSPKLKPGRNPRLENGPIKGSISKSGTDVGGGVSNQDILAWCQEASLEFDEIMLEVNFLLNTTQNYYVANQTLISRLKSILADSNKVYRSSYVSKVIERVINLHNAIGGNELDKSQSYYRVVFEYLLAYSDVIKEMAYDLDVLYLGQAGIQEIEIAILEFAKEQAVLVLDFNVTAVVNGEAYVKEADIFVKSVNFIAGEMATDIQDSFLAEKYSCAYRKALKAQKSGFGGKKIRVNLKYDAFRDFIQRMNICS